jgi:copper chaperone CopZ
VIELTVNHMTCGHCLSAVTRAVKALDSQALVDVDLAAKRVRVEGAMDAAEVIRALDAAGYAAGPVTAQPQVARKTGGCCGCQ